MRMVWLWHGEDAALKFAQEEATLTRDLTGMAKSMENLFNSNPG